MKQTTVAKAVAATKTKAATPIASPKKKTLAARQAAPEPTLDAVAFFNRIGEMLSAYETAKNITAFEIRKSLPHVDALEDLGADWTLNKPYERSFFAVLANLDLRFVENANNFFWGWLIPILTPFLY